MRFIATKKVLSPSFALILSFLFENVWQWKILSLHSSVGNESANAKSGASVKLLSNSCIQLT